MKRKEVESKRNREKGRRGEGNRIVIREEEQGKDGGQRREE